MNEWMQNGSKDPYIGSFFLIEKILWRSWCSWYQRCLLPGNLLLVTSGTFYGFVMSQINWKAPFKSWMNYNGKSRNADVEVFWNKTHNEGKLISGVSNRCVCMTQWVFPSFVDGVSNTVGFVRIIKSDGFWVSFEVSGIISLKWKIKFTNVHNCPSITINYFRNLNHLLTSLYFKKGNYNRKITEKRHLNANS